MAEAERREPKGVAIKGAVRTWHGYVPKEKTEGRAVFSRRHTNTEPLWSFPSASSAEIWFHLHILCRGVLEVSGVLTASPAAEREIRKGSDGRRRSFPFSTNVGSVLFRFARLILIRCENSKNNCQVFFDLKWKLKSVRPCNVSANRRHDHISRKRVMWLWHYMFLSWLSDQEVEGMVAAKSHRKKRTSGQFWRNNLRPCLWRQYRIFLTSPRDVSLCVCRHQRRYFKPQECLFTTLPSCFYV